MLLLALALGGSVFLVGGLLWQSLPRTGLHAPKPAAALRAKGAGLAHGFSASTIDVSAFAHALLESCAATARSRGIGLRLAVAPGLRVRCDLDALHDALHDMIAAAMDHAGTTAILLSAHPHGGRVEIAITDDGTGPDAEVQVSLLRQAEQALALHGATIEVDAEPQGSMVRLRLPAPPVDPVAAPPVPAAQPAMKATPPEDDRLRGSGPLLTRAGHA
ncbi:MAG: hypothetical protein KGL12_02420 [Rhodospirillales bacterium]|nr:hypothetical protein [Rhodospirillales bacterium]